MNFDTNRETIKKAIEASRNQTAADRRRYARLVKKFAGVEEGKKNKIRPRLINLLRQSGAVTAMQLSSGSPRYQVCTDEPGPARGFARTSQTHLNRLSKEIHLEEVLATCVLSSFFKMGIVKAQFDEQPLLFGTDSWVMAGKPSLVPLSYEEYGHDMTARRISQLGFQYDFYDVVWDKLRENDLYDKKVTDRIKRDASRGYAYEGENEPSARSAFGYAPQQGRQIQDMVRLIDVYFPREKKLVTWPFRMDTPPLRVMDVTDPDGPYRLLYFDDVPDNTLPASPAENEEPLDDLHNSVWRKIAMLAEQMREFFLYEQGFEEDAEKQRTADHGRYVGVKNMESTQIRKINGPDQNIVAVSALVSQWYDRMADNLSLRAGLSNQAPTASQEELLQQNNSGTNARRKYRVHKFAGECGQALLRRLMDNPSYTASGWREDKDLRGHPIPDHWTGTYRVGTADTYCCTVEEYSLTYRSPEQKANALLGTLNDLAPLNQVFAAAGYVPHPPSILQTLSEYRNQPEILEWYQAAPAGMQAPSADDIRQSPRTERTTIRKSAGGGDPTQKILQSMTAAAPTQGAA